MIVTREGEGNQEQTLQRPEVPDVVKSLNSLFPSVIEVLQ
jgi:hypothetical protein